MKRVCTVIAVLLLVALGLFLRVAISPLRHTKSKPSLVVQGQTVSNWLSAVEMIGVPGLTNQACEVLVSAGAPVVPELCHVLLASESAKDLVLRLPVTVVSVDKKYVRANESEILTRKAQAAWVLGGIIYRGNPGSELSNAVRALVSGLHSGSPIVQYMSAQALAAAGSHSSNAVSDLVNLTTHGVDSGVRMSAAEAIGRIGISTPDAIAALNRALTDTNSDVRATANQALQILQRDQRSPERRP